MSWQGDPESLNETVRSLNKLLDLDLAIIEDAYQAEYMARLQRTERLATLGQVAGGIAHELRNPLNVVKTSAYYLLNARNPTAEKRVDHLKRIERNVELADNVITSLSNFARMPVPELVPFPIEPLVRESLEINAPGQDIEVVVDCPPDLPHALGDRDQLQIVLGNLIRNARDAMSLGGRLTITGSVQRRQRRALRGRYRAGYRGDRAGQDHGAALFDEGARSRPGACNFPVDRGKKPGSTHGHQRNRTRQHVHDSTQRINR